MEKNDDVDEVGEGFDWRWRTDGDFLLFPLLPISLVSPPRVLLLLLLPVRQLVELKSSRSGDLQDVRRRRRRQIALGITFFSCFLASEPAWEKGYVSAKVFRSFARRSGMSEDGTRASQLGRQAGIRTTAM